MYVNRHACGMILLTTIILLSLLAALMFSMQRALWLYTKVHQKTYAYHEAFNQLEAVAFKLGENGLNTAKISCFSEVSDVNHALLMLNAGRGCLVTKNNTRYQYWINQMKPQKKQWVIGVQLEADPKTQIILRFSKTKGLMSWRYIS
ncbi:MAG: hypothetical protein QNK11_05515 [Legionella sp.]|nr:hypothetical protein [Legionella sp.]